MCLLLNFYNTNNLRIFLQTTIIYSIPKNFTLVLICKNRFDFVHKNSNKSVVEDDNKCNILKSDLRQIMRRKLKVVFRIYNFKSTMKYRNNFIRMHCSNSRFQGKKIESVEDFKPGIDSEFDFEPKHGLATFKLLSNEKSKWNIHRVRNKQ